MDAPPTRYAVRDGVHIGYQVWGDGPVDVLEFNHGLMISIDETVDEPNWLGYTERVAAFSRLIRFDAGGLGLSDPLPAGRPPSVEVWADDALAVLDAAGCERAVVLCNTGGSMAAHVAGRPPPRTGGRPDRRQRHGPGGPGRRLRVRGTRRAHGRRGARTSRCRSTATPCPRTSPSSPPAWPTGSASPSGGGERPGGAPARPRPSPSTWSPSPRTCATCCRGCAARRWSCRAPKASSTWSSTAATWPSTSTAHAS